MNSKIVFLIMPLIISSTSNLPLIINLDRTNAVSGPIITFKPIEISTPPTINDDFLYCDLYGPFDIDNLKNVNATFTYEFHTVASQNIIERIRLLNSSNSVVASSAKNTIAYTRGFRNEVTFTIPLKNYLTNNGLTLKFEIINSSSREILKGYSAAIYPSSKSYISGVTLKRNVYQSRSVGFYADGEQLNEAIETFDFTHFGDYLDVDYYYRLDINKNTFLYPNDYNLNFTYNYAYLWFNDDDNLFPYYYHNSSGDITIPISLVRKGDVISFKYNKTFYLNRRTLQISDTYRSGFIATSDFYLPVNGRTKFNNKQLWFEINNMGLDGLSTSIPVRYDTSKSLVGVCKDGDYCVIGGKR